MEFAVSRTGTTLITLHDGTDTTAKDAAIEQLESTLATLTASSDIESWSIDEATVYEHPAAPFDPFTISVTFSVTVPVEGHELEEAEARGVEVIEAVLDQSDVDSITFADSSVSAAT